MGTAPKNADRALFGALAIACLVLTVFGLAVFGAVCLIAR